MDINKNQKLDPVSFSIWLTGSILGKTWRVSVKSRPQPDPYNDFGTGRIYSLWHSQLLPLAFIFRNTGKTAVISRSRDGVRAANVTKKWKYDVIYGSSSKGGMAALRQCIRVLKMNRCAVITPDGPRGPREIIKNGIAQLSLISGAPVVPISAFADSYWRLKSWDRFVIPKPFSKITVHVAEPVYPQKITGDNKLEQMKTLIQEKMNDFKLA